MLVLKSFEMMAYAQFDMVISNFEDFVTIAIDISCKILIDHTLLVIRFLIGGQFVTWFLIGR